MGLLRRKPSPRRELAVALAQRGVTGRATVVALHERGHARDAAVREVALTLDVELPGGGVLRVAQTQAMTRFTLHGLAPGEPVRILHDRDDPRLLAVLGHARLRSEVVDGEIAVTVERAPSPAR